LVPIISIDQMDNASASVPKKLALKLGGGSPLCALGIEGTLISKDERNFPLLCFSKVQLGGVMQQLQPGSVNRTV